MIESAFFLTLILTACRPRLGALLIAAGLPGYLLRGSVAGIPTTALELGVYGAIVGAAVAVAAGRIPRPTFRLPRLVWLLLACWIAGWVVGTAASWDRESSFGALKAWLLDPLLFAALLWTVIRTRDDRRRLLDAAFGGGAIVAIAGFAQFIAWPTTLQEGRLSSFFAPVANYAAMYLGPIFMANIAALAYGRRTWSRWVSAVVMLVAIGLTLSYGAFLAIAVVSIFLWAFIPNKQLQRRLFVLGAATAAIAFTVLASMPNFAQHFSPGRSSGSVRQEIWRTSWYLIERHPFTGIGPNAFEPAYRDAVQYVAYPPLEWLVVQPHNLYLALWLETGLLGLLAFCGLILLFARGIRGELAAGQRGAALVALAGVAAILVHGLVDTTYFKNDLAMLTALFLLVPWIGQAPVHET